MDNKLQELTERLYNEGLSKGKEEGAQILENAKKEAAAIIAAAKEEATAVAEAAAKAADDLRAKAESDIRMASAQSLQATRKDIENILVGSIAGPKVDAALASPDFIKEIIRTVAQKFSADQMSDLEMILPESLKSQLEPFVSGELAEAIGHEVKADFSKKIAGGFTIGPKDGGYFISLTDETFKDLICEYLRPVTKKLLFG